MYTARGISLSLPLIGNVDLCTPAQYTPFIDRMHHAVSEQRRNGQIWLFSLLAAGSYRVIISCCPENAQ